MFYVNKIDDELRFGDIIAWGTFVTPKYGYKPINLDFKVDLNFPQFSAVLTPCCSIEGNDINLSPLIKINKNYLNNTNFEGNLTAINRKMEPQMSVHPLEWKSFSPEEKARREAEGLTYGFLDKFIYDQHELLPYYYLDKERKRKTNYYMISFKNNYKIDLANVKDKNNILIKSKHLQLSVKSRNELRRKIATYYSREPKEDKICNLY